VHCVALAPSTSPFNITMVAHPPGASRISGIFSVGVLEQQLVHCPAQPERVPSVQNICAVTSLLTDDSFKRTTQHDFLYYSITTPVLKKNKSNGKTVKVSREVLFNGMLLQLKSFYRHGGGNAWNLFLLSFRF